MRLADLKKQLDEMLHKQFNAKIVMDKFRLIDEAGRRAGAYSDPLYVPFYYHLGRLAQPTALLEIGFRLGLFSGAFLRSCKTVKNFLAFQEANGGYYSPRLGKANVRDHYKGRTHVHVGSTLDEDFLTRLQENKWGLIILNEETSYDKHMAYLDLVWSHAEFDGLIVMDYIARHPPARQAFADFCKGKNREGVTFGTRYGTGIVQK